jgi:hypothetical protein
MPCSTKQYQDPGSSGHIHRDAAWMAAAGAAFVKVDSCCGSQQRTEAIGLRGVSGRSQCNGQASRPPRMHTSTGFPFMSVTLSSKWIRVAAANNGRKLFLTTRLLGML